MLEHYGHTCSSSSVSPRPIHLEQEHPRDLHQNMDFFRCWVLAKCAHRLCYLDTPTASCVEPEDGKGAKNLCRWHTYVGLTVSC